MFEVRQFEVLRAIAREGSLAAAGRALGFSQPTITHHLAALEAQARMTLVRRGARGAVLTAAGEILLGHAEVVLDRLQMARHELRTFAERGAASLRIGTFPTAGALLLPPAVKRLRDTGVEVSLTEGELPQLVHELLAGRIDTALVFSQPGEDLELGEQFEVHHLLDDPLELVLPARHPQARHARVRLESLREDGWIMGHSDWDPVDRVLGWACEQAGFEPVRVMRTDDYAVLRGFVAAGVGIALLPRLGLTAEQSGLAIRPVDTTALTDGTALARTIGLALPIGDTTAGTQLLHALKEQTQQLTVQWASERGRSGPGPSD